MGIDVKGAEKNVIPGTIFFLFQLTVKLLYLQSQSWLLPLATVPEQILECKKSFSKVKGPGKERKQIAT